MADGADSGPPLHVRPSMPDNARQRSARLPTSAGPCMAAVPLGRRPHARKARPVPRASRCIIEMPRGFCRGTPASPLPEPTLVCTLVCMVCTVPGRLGACVWALGIKRTSLRANYAVQRDQSALRPTLWPDRLSKSKMSTVLLVQHKRFGLKVCLTATELATQTMYCYDYAPGCPAWQVSQTAGVNSACHVHMPRPGVNQLIALQGSGAKWPQLARRSPSDTKHGQQVRLFVSTWKPCITVSDHLYVKHGAATARFGKV